MDCLVGKDFDSISPVDPDPDYKTCQLFCSKRARCRAFAVWQGTCYFKDRDCENDQFEKSGVTLFIPQGKATEIILILI